MSACDDKPVGATPAVIDLWLADEAATLALGGTLARMLEQSGDLLAGQGLDIHLLGDLGAGKTTLVRGLLHGLGYEGRVRSPTYTIVELYAISKLVLYHFDFYRFETAEEYLDGGFEEYFGKTAINLVEWSDKAAPYLPPADLQLGLELAVVQDQVGRRARLQACSARGEQCLKLCQNLRPDLTGMTVDGASC